MIKVLFIIPSFSSPGGAEKLVDSLVHLLNAHYEISIASFDSKYTKSYFKNATAFYPLGDGPRLPYILRFLTYLIAAYRLSVLKRELGINLAISVLWRADLMNVLSRGKEKIISLGVINILNNDTNAMMVKLRLLVGFFYRRFDKILAISTSINKELITLYRLDKKKLGVFKNFLSSPKSSPFFSDNLVRFVFCGRAVHEKNIDGLLLVFAKFTTKNPGRQLVVIGDGPLFESMKDLAIKLGLTFATQVTPDAQVLFIGSSSTPEAYMIGARAFLLTSRHEGVPTVAILAAALGLPILAADCLGGGMRMLFEIPPDEPLLDPDFQDGDVAGLLLPVPEFELPETIDVWVRAMEVVDRNQAKRGKWVQNALRLAAKHSPESVRKDWVSIIESTLVP
jgi:glycosyltransferase involved in cell wall biosynthesis